MRERRCVGPASTPKCFHPFLRIKERLFEVQTVYRNGYITLCEEGPQPWERRTSSVDNHHVTNLVLGGRLLRDRAISRSERHLKTTSNPEPLENEGGLAALRSGISVPDVSPAAEASFQRMSSARATDGMLHKFRRSFASRFRGSPSTHQKGDSDVVLRSAKCKRAEKEQRHSADSGIQVESTSSNDSPALVRRRAVSTSEAAPTTRPLSDCLVDPDDASSARALLLSERARLDLNDGPLRRTPSMERQLSTPPPIKLRTAEQRSFKPTPIRRHRGTNRAKIRRSISQPLDLERILSRKGSDHGLSDQECSPSTASSDEDFSSENESYAAHNNTPFTPRQPSFRELYGESVTYAEALWDHVTIDAEELPFKAGEVIEVTDSSDRDWWWGSITNRSGWFPAAFVRLRVSQEDTVEDCMVKMADGTLTRHAPRKMSVSLLSNDQVRASIVREIVSTERDFVQHLRDLVEGYLKQVRRRSDMFAPEEVSVIFGNIQEIYAFQSGFLRHLESAICWEAPHQSQVGRCFLHHKEKFKIYSEYCNNHPLAVSQLQELYAEAKYIHFFEACRLLQEMIDISLDGFLLTPVQKICKYPLQLGELLKYTKPDHPDYQPVRDALGAMRGVAQLVNERKRRMECLEKLAEWQRGVDAWEGPELLESSSVLIHSGEVTRVTSKWSRDVSLFLFDHLLVYCKKDLLKRNTCVYKGRVNTDCCCVFDVEDGKDAQFGIGVKNAWKVYCAGRDKWFLFYAKSVSEKQRWLRAFREERQHVKEDKEQDFQVSDQDKKAAKAAVVNKLKPKRPRAKLAKGQRPHPDTAVAEILLDPPGPKTRSGSLPSNLSPAFVVNGAPRAPLPPKKKGSGWFHFGSGKKSKK